MKKLIYFLVGAITGGAICYAAKDEKVKNKCKHVYVKSSEKAKEGIDKLKYSYKKHRKCD